MSLSELAKNFSLKKLADSEVELTGEVPAELIAPYQVGALTHIAEHMELPGFRPGKVPPHMAKAKAGELRVLEEAVNLFLQDFYPELVDGHKLDVVGRPIVNITKLAPQNPVGLSIRTALYPEVTLPQEWKLLSQKVPLEGAVPVEEADVEKTLEQLRQSRKKDEVVPELNDEFAKSVGAFENLEALKQQIKKGMGEERERAAREKRRGNLIDLLLEKTKVEVPKIFVESELEKIMTQLREDVSRFGLKFEDYLKQVQKSQEAVREDFRTQATKRAKLQLALNKIGTEEKIVADSEAIETELKHALEHFPDAKPELVRIHIETVLRNEKILKLLEGEDKKE